MSEATEIMTSGTLITTTQVLAGVLAVIGVFYFITGIIHFYQGILHNDENKNKGVMQWIMGVIMIGIRLMMPSSLPEMSQIEQNITTSTEIVSEVANEIENHDTVDIEENANTVEMPSEQEGNNTGIIILWAIALCPFVIAVSLLNKSISERKKYLEGWEQYSKDVKKHLNAGEDTIESECDASTQLEDLKETIKNMADDDQKKVKHIISSVEWLDQHKVDTRKLYTYYIPELFDIFTQSKSILDKKCKSTLSEERKKAKELWDKALQTVINVVDELVSRQTDSELDKMECNAKVMEAMAKQDGYVSDMDKI